MSGILSVMRSALESADAWDRSNLDVAAAIADQFEAIAARVETELPAAAPDVDSRTAILTIMSLTGGSALGALVALEDNVAAEQIRKRIGIATSKLAALAAKEA